MKRLLALLLAAVACTDAIPPERAETYSFTIDCSEPDLCTSEADPDLRLIFRWPASAMPVRVWAEPQGDLPHQVRRGMQSWEEALLFAELRTVVVGDSARADILVLREQAATIQRAIGVSLPSCTSSTELAVGLDTAIVLPFRIRVAPRLGAGIEESEDCLQLVVTHELGHALGLLLDSPDIGDLMFGSPAVHRLSRADVATLGKLYHSAPTVRVPAGR